MSKITKSCCPISLTSIIGKVMKGLVTNCHRYETETRRLLSDIQAGSRSGRSTEDQLIRLSQSISDGFQRSPMKRTILTLIVYSRAYNRVWQDDLKLIMPKTGVSPHLIRWIMTWQANRQSWVTFQGVKSKKTILKQ